MARLFPGKGWKETVKNELRDIFIHGEFRKEFYVMIIYSILLLVFSILTLKVENLAPGEHHKIYWLFAVMGAYYLLDDFFRRKKILSQPLLFTADAFFYNSIILSIVIMTGGFDSPLRFFLFFLTAISSPIYGTAIQTAIFMLSISLLQITLYYAYFGISPHLIIAFLDGCALLGTSALIKISVNSYENKARDYALLYAEQEILYQEASDYSARLEDSVAEKTKELQNLLKQAEQEKVNSDRQRIATMNILEDMTETQEELKNSKMSLETRQEELKAVAELSGKLNSSATVQDAIDMTNEYLGRFVDFNSTTFILLDVNGKGNFAVRSLVSRPVSRKLLSLSVKEAANLLLNYKAIDDSLFEEILASTPAVSGEKIFDQDNLNQYATFTLPFKIGERVFGSVHIASENPEFFKESGKREIISAIISTASVALSGLEQAIKAQNSKTQSLIRSLTNGIIMMDKDMEVVLANPAAEKFTGINENGAGMEEFLDSIKDYDLRSMISKAAAEGEDGQIKEIEIGDKFLEIYIVAVKDFEANIMGVVLIIHDITNLKAIDQMKSEFVSVASHQLRTPLTAIRLFLEMLMKGDVGELSASQKEYLRHVFESTDRMVRLVNDLLNVSRIESNRMQIQPEPTQLEDLIADVVEEAKPLAELRNVRLEFGRMKKNTPLVPVDRSLFRQIIHNLVTNAIKYSETGGTAGVSLSMKGEDYLIAVEDDGIGIPEKFKMKMFQKFSRADNAVKTETEGTGLGLYVSAKIVESFRGKIWFEPKNKGTIFHVLLPGAGMSAKQGERGLVIS